MENCQLPGRARRGAQPAALPSAPSPQECFTLLTKVFTTDMGVDSAHFMLHAFMSVAVQETLRPLAVRENLNCRNSYVQMHSRLGKSTAGGEEWGWPMLALIAARVPVTWWASGGGCRHCCGIL